MVGVEVRGYEIISLPGEYIVSGSTASFGNGVRDVIVMKIDNSGNLIWAKTYGGSLDEEHVTKSRIKDGTISLISSTQSFGNGNWDYYEVVMDTSGNAGGCNTQTINPVVMSHNITAVNKTVSTASSGVVANAAVTVTNVNLNSNFLCSDTIQSNLASLAPFPDVCVSDSAFVITGGSPAGGIYSGSGIVNGMFDPMLAGVGTHIINYEANCVNVNETITVHPLPIVTLPAFLNVDLTTFPFALTGGSPVGGNYSGPGVTTNIFDPSVAGLGTHTIIYTFTDSVGCTGSDSATITVIQQTIVVTLDPFADVCVDDTPFVLTGGLPVGGTYSGPGVVNGMFDPSVAGVGTHTITYSFAGQTATQMITVNPLPVVTVSVTGGTVGCNNTFIIGAGSQIVITATSATVVSYQWYHDGNLMSGANSSTLNVTQGGTYTTVVTDANGCMSDPNAPGASVNINGITANCGNNNTKVILCHYPPGNNGNPQTLCIAPSAVPAHLANHPGDCLGPCPGQKIAPPSVIIEDMHYHISPNPFTDNAEISFMVFEKGNVKINLQDLLGRNIQILYESYTEADKEHTVQLDARRLPQGVYLIQFTTPDGIATEKVTVVR